MKRARQKFWVKQRAGWVTRPRQWEKVNLFPGAWLGICCWQMFRRFVFGLRVNSKGRTQSVVWVSLIDEKASLLIKHHSGVFNVSVSKIKCTKALSKLSECAKITYCKYPKLIVRAKLFCFLFSSSFFPNHIRSECLSLFVFSASIKDRSNYRLILFSCLMCAKFIRKDVGSER